jgi:hypothetical protein
MAFETIVSASSTTRAGGGDGMPSRPGPGIATSLCQFQTTGASSLMVCACDRGKTLSGSSTSQARASASPRSRGAPAFRDSPSAAGCVASFPAGTETANSGGGRARPVVIRNISARISTVRPMAICWGCISATGTSRGSHVAPACASRWTLDIPGSSASASVRCAPWCPRTRSPSYGAGLTGA